MVVEWSPRAGHGLLAIEAFTAEYSRRPPGRVMAEIRRHALQLETFP